MSDYKADIEAALASIILAQSAKKVLERSKAIRAFLDHLEAYPELRVFYDLMKKAESR